MTTSGATLATGSRIDLIGALRGFALPGVRWINMIWGVQIASRLVWLRFFRMGPLEWAWRSLVFWASQPLLKAVVS